MKRRITLRSGEGVKIQDKKRLRCTALFRVRKGSRWAVHLSYKKCSEQGFNFFQLAALVTEEGGTVHTINSSTATMKGE